MAASPAAPVRAIITGFGPFPTARQNPTAALARRLARLRRPAFADIERGWAVFPVQYAAVDAILMSACNTHDPDVLLMFGLAGRARGLRVERFARNTMPGLLPDIAGRPAPPPIAGAPASRAFGGHDAALVRAIRAAGVPAQLSISAGRYLCNHLCWRALERHNRTGAPRIAAFIHVPPLGRDGLTAADLLRAGEAALRVMVTEARKLKRAG